MLLFGHRQLEAVGKCFFVLADECGQTLKQMKVSANHGPTCTGSFPRSSQPCFSKSHDPPSNRATRTHLDE